jgi:Bacterial TSP3 repeat
MSPLIPFALPALLLAAVSTAARAQTSVSPANRYAYGANTGWIDARGGDGTFGMKAGPCVLKGFLYSANCGWINLGDGDPDNGSQYSNTTGQDCGVNRLPDGRLRGLAWGAAIGWINFETTGNPRIDPLSGLVTGYAWSAGTGWISLDTPQTDLKVISQDSDGDTIPDVWETLYAPNLTVLGQTKDTDGDGLTDSAEYAAGTNPTDRTEYLRITSLNYLPGNNAGTLRWTAVQNRSYRVEQSTDLQSWQTLATRVYAIDGATTAASSVPKTGPQRFFRVIALKPPAGE